MSTDSPEVPPPVVADCPTCEELVEVSSGVGVCDSCGTVVPAASNRMLLGPPPTGVELRANAKADGEGVDPYRDSGLEEPKLQMLVAHKSRPFMLRKIGLSITLFYIAFRYDISIVASLSVAAVGVAVLLWGLIPRTRRFEFVASLDGLTAGPEGVPSHRCEQMSGDEIDAVLARATIRTQNPADRRFEIIAVDSSGNNRLLLEGVEDAGRAAWMVARIEHALGFEQD